MKKAKLLLLLCSFLMLGTMSSWAQGVTTSSIRGKVVGPDGRPLTAANIVAIHMPSGTQYGTITSQDGNFTIKNMRIGGPYKVVVSFIGYQKQEFTDIELSLGVTYDLSVTLVPQDQALEEVKVVGTTREAVISKERTGAATSIKPKELRRLPTISRSIADFYRLDPRASSNGSFGGRNDQFNNFSLDGSIFNNPFGLDAATPGGQTDAQPISLDAIEQVQVAIAPYDVTQAGFTGASVNAVTKSGTNDFHGTVYGFFRNQNLTGGKVSGDDVFKADLSQSQSGVSLGGPIVKNKLFFFANFERDDRSDLGSDYVAAGPGVSGKNVSRVLATDLQKVSDLLSGIGYETGPYQGFMFDTKSTKGIFKLDWNINSHHRLAAIYNFLDASKEKPAHPDALGRRGPDATTLQFENSGYQINNKIQSYLIELNSDFGDNISNKLQAGFTHFDDSRSPFSTPMPPITIQKDGVNYIIAGHEPFSIHNRLDQKVYQASDNLTIFSGNHTFTLGTSIEKFLFDNSFNLGAYGFGDSRGYVGAFGAFASVADFETAINDGLIADAMANAQNLYDTNNANGTWALAETNVGQFAFYGQDEWAVSDEFRLTVGLRGDLPLYFNTKDKIQENIDRAGADYHPEIVYYDKNHNPIQFDQTKLPDQKILWSPRLGFNWNVNGEGKLQIRGGTGLFSGRLPFVWIGNQVANPNFWFYCVTAPDFRFPQVWRNSLGADKVFNNGLTTSVDISYTKDIYGMMVRNYGLKAPSATLQGVDNRPVYDPVADRTTFGNNAYVFTNTDKGYQFNSTFKIQKYWKDGWYAMVAYNFLISKDASSIEAEISSDAYDRNPALGDVNQAVESNSLYGDKHRIIGSANRKFTYGENGKWETTLGVFFEYARGGRFSYTYSGDINGDGSALNDLIYIPTASEVNQMNFTEANMAPAFEAFIEQDDYLNHHRGKYMEKYAILSPWRSRWDVRVLQDFNFKVSDGRTNKIEFSVDILNFGNLINSNWGVVQVPLNRQPIGVTVDNNYVPTYSFDVSQKTTFVDDFSLASRWQIQLGLRYIF